MNQTYHGYVKQVLREFGHANPARGPCAALQSAGPHHRDLRHGDPGVGAAFRLFRAGAPFAQCGKAGAHPADRGDASWFRLRSGGFDHRARRPALCHVHHLRADVRARLEPAGHGPRPACAHLGGHGSAGGRAAVLFLLPLLWSSRERRWAISSNLSGPSGGSPG